MKIALVTTEFFPFLGGGIGTYCESVTRALVAKGHEVHVITCVPGPEEVYGATIHRCKIPYITPKEVVRSEFIEWELNSSNLYYVESYFWAVEIKKVVEEYNIDIIECQESMAPIYFYLYKRLLDISARYIPVVVHLHTPSYELALWEQSPMETPEMHMIRFMEDFSINVADAVLSPSQFLATCVSSRLPEIRNKLEVIPYPSFEKVADIPNVEKDSDRKEIVYVGRLEHRKGIEVLVNAMTRIMASNDNLRIRFIGKSMHSHVWGIKYQDWIANRLLQFADRVIFDGVLGRHEILSKMKAADCVVIPSIGENFPNVCMEAMLCGSVIVASDQGGMAEMMGGRENGFLFEGSNVDSLVSVIEKVLALPGSATAKIRESASNRIKDFCDIDKIITRRIEHYEKILVRTGEGKQSRTFPIHLVCGGKHSDARSARKVESVAAVILDDGSCSANSVLTSLVSGRRKPDEILILGYGARGHLEARLLDNMPVSIKKLWIDSMDLAEVKNYAMKNVNSDAMIYLKTRDSVNQDFIEKSIGILDEYPEIAYVQPWVKGGRQVANPLVPFFPYFLYNHCFVTSTGMIRKVALDEIHGFSSGLNFHFLDWELVLSLMKKGWGSMVLDEILVNSEVYDYDTRQRIESGIGGVMYARLIGKNEELFECYKHQLLITAWSLLSVSNSRLYNRLSGFERRMLGIYRTARNVLERICHKILN